MVRVELAPARTTASRRRFRPRVGESSLRLQAIDRATASEAGDELFLDLRHVDVLGERG
jgi:hypothetical protein